MKCFSCEYKNCYFASKICYMGCANYKAEVIKVYETEESIMRKNPITEKMAKEFYRDLCGTVYGNSNKNCMGIMPIELIAEHMGISIDKANDFCAAMIKYGITERQNGMIVV